MAVVRFTATRSLIGGVSLNDTITYNLPVRYAGMRRSREVFQATRRSMGGRREAYRETVENRYGISTKPLTATQAAALVMFLDSTESREEFEFAPNNVSSDPSPAWADSVREGDGYEEAPVPERDDLKVYAFTIAVLP